MGIFNWWCSRGGAVSAEDRQRIDETVERVVETTNPRLRFAPRYRARLAPAVATSLAYVHELVAAVPPAREASAAAWSNDPYMRAFFATADDIASAFSRAPDLRAHFEQNPGLAEAYAVLGMEMTERKILGMVIEGNSIRRDVPQTTVSFSDHRVRICGRTEPELRVEIERRLVDQLALQGLANIVADQSRRTEIEQERALLKARLQMHERKGTGMRASLGGEAVGQEELVRLQAQIDESTRNLGSLGGGAQMLDHELEHIRRVLAEPAQHLYISSKRLRIDRMNVVIDAGNTEAGTELEFLVARVPANVAGEMRAFSLVRFARAELLASKRLFDDAARLLG
jgi:hypothetical protein